MLDLRNLQWLSGIVDCRSEIMIEVQLNTYRILVTIITLAKRALSNSFFHCLNSTQY